jgi:hypothetical protein
MEVHQHSHTGKKKRIHYFWEFLMLFLAVFLGYQTENLREHKQEHRRERQYIHSLLLDLAEDTFQLTKTSAFRLNREEKLDSLIRELGGKDVKAHAAGIYRLSLESDDYETFSRSDRTIQQLKNAGGMRLIRNDSVNNAIMYYDNFIINELEWNGRSEADKINFYKQLRYQVLNSQLINKVSNSHGSVEKSDLALFSDSPIAINALSGGIFEVISISASTRDSEAETKKGAIELMKLIERQYHIK